MKIKLFKLLSPTYLIDISDIDIVINPFTNKMNLKLEYFQKSFDLRATILAIKASKGI